VVKAGKREATTSIKEVPEPARGDACDPVIDDVDELIMSLDCEPAEPQAPEEINLGLNDVELPRSPKIPDGSNDAGAVPWLDRFDSTERLIEQLEDTLKMMEDRGVNLTSAWQLATTARSLLESADVVQALIYANRSFRMALEVQRGDGQMGAAAS
jgi:hypothetical protein